MDGSAGTDRILGGIDQIDAAQWDALGSPDDPFTTHRFLLALEASGSVGPGTGWTPQHLVLTENARAVAAMPLYVKSHSQGEYIFDHAFADAWARAGGRYYPKLQVAVPFTPATGRRLLTAPGHDHRARDLLELLKGATRGNGLSSAHVTFCTRSEADLGAGAGFIHRQTEQFHWENPGWRDFNDFLGALSSDKRKALRKERARAQGFGGEIVALTGDAIRPEHWDAFWAFYQDTGARKWGRPYLTRAFFDLIHETMRDDILLVLAIRGGVPVAGALNFIGRDTLFGRYWGCSEDHPCLHFELCYYQAIDWALANGRHRVEAGAQGAHKLARGYLPRPVHSLHWFADAGFQRAVAAWVQDETRAIETEIMSLSGPYKQERPCPS
jgi:predicted N-acyltransferase